MKPFANHYRTGSASAWSWGFYFWHTHTSVVGGYNYICLNGGGCILVAFIILRKKRHLKLIDGKAGSEIV